MMHLFASENLHRLSLATFLLLTGTTISLAQPLETNLSIQTSPAPTSPSPATPESTNTETNTVPILNLNQNSPPTSEPASSPSPISSPESKSLLQLNPSATLALSPPNASTRIATVEPDDIEGFSNFTPKIQRLILSALELTRKGLKYRYGSDDPSLGGMDCSGTINYLLISVGLNHVPRQADQIYRWAWEKSVFHAVNGHTFESFEFQLLKPGDLLFWTGTYHVDADRDPPVSHVMLYLGKSKTTGQRLMFGASEGRPYQGIPRYGVSVFDFKLPHHGKRETDENSCHFLGYGSIPGF